MSGFTSQINHRWAMNNVDVFKLIFKIHQFYLWKTQSCNSTPSKFKITLLVQSPLDHLVSQFISEDFDSLWWKNPFSWIKQASSGSPWWRALWWAFINTGVSSSVTSQYCNIKNRVLFNFGLWFLVNLCWWRNKFFKIENILFDILFPKAPFVWEYFE